MYATQTFWLSATMATTQFAGCYFDWTQWAPPKRWTCSSWGSKGLYASLSSSINWKICDWQHYLVHWNFFFEKFWIQMKFETDGQFESAYFQNFYSKFKLIWNWFQQVPNVDNIPCPSLRFIMKKKTKTYSGGTMRPPTTARSHISFNPTWWIPNATIVTRVDSKIIAWITPIDMIALRPPWKIQLLHSSKMFAELVNVPSFMPNFTYQCGVHNTNKTNNRIHNMHIRLSYWKEKDEKQIISNWFFSRNHFKCVVQYTTCIRKFVKC